MAKVGMLKATASINASHTISSWNAGGIAFFVSIAVMIGIVIACIAGFKSCMNSLGVNDDTTPRDKIPIERIEDTLKLTHENIKDVNKDGLVNCIDYAYLFKKYYGYHARIIRNVNKETGMDHLLNAVQFTDRDPISKWIFVEPQGDKYTWRPDTYWGSKYDHEYDYDETWKWYR
jgi:hypothetical protein